MERNTDVEHGFITLERESEILPSTHRRKCNLLTVTGKSNPQCFDYHLGVQTGNETNLRGVITIHHTWDQQVLKCKANKMLRL